MPIARVMEEPKCDGKMSKSISRHCKSVTKNPETKPSVNETLLTAVKSDWVVVTKIFLSVPSWVHAVAAGRFSRGRN